jgi:RNA polymerase sigma factor (sigma-70 family)
MLVTHVIERARTGDLGAREQVYGLLRERVTRTAKRYAGMTGMDSDDLQQEMWIGMLAGLEQVDSTIGDPLFYLFLRAKWRLLEAVRRSHRTRTEPLADSGETLFAGFEEEVSARWMATELQSRLGRPQRAILRGLLAGYSQEELSRSLGCTPANVSYHVRKIREGYTALAEECPGR